MPKIYLTFDVEEWPEARYLPNGGQTNTTISKEGCLRLIELLDKYKIKSTFFITGKFALEQVETVRMIAKENHEIACHSYHHCRLTALSLAEIEKEIVQATAIINKITGLVTRGFRAPGCYISDEILKVLISLGYTYDSSLHPAIVPGHYYNWHKPMTPYWIEGSILEIPLSVIPGIRFPISWWWMRNIGNWVTHLGTKINLWQKRDVILYFHSWEFADFPSNLKAPFHLKRLCGGKYLKKLDSLISCFSEKYQFSTLKQLAEEERRKR